MEAKEIDQLELMVNLISVIEADEASVEIELKKFKCYIENKIDRQMADQEYLDLIKAIYDYIKSDPITPERTSSMDYLFNCKFIKIVTFKLNKHELSNSNIDSSKGI